MASLGDLLLTVGVKLDQFEAAMGSVSTRLNSVLRDGDRVTSGFDRLGGKLNEIGGVLSIGVTAPIAAATGAMLHFGGTFEVQMNRVQALGDITGDSLNRLKDQALLLGAQTKFSAAEAAQGMAELASAGFTATQVYQAMPGVLSLAASGMVSVEDAAKITKNTIQQFGLTTQDSGRVADVFAKALADSSAGLNDFGLTMNYVGPIAKSLGISFEDTAAAVVILDKAGIQAEKAGTGLRGMLGSLLDPSKESARLMKSLGIEINDLATGKLKSLPDILESLRQGFDRTSTDAQRAKVLFQLFGRESATAATILINQGGPALTSISEKLNAVGYSAKQAQILNSGLTGAMEQLTGSVETAAITAGNTLIPTVVLLAGSLQNLVDNYLVPGIKLFQQLPDSVQLGSLAFVALVAAAGPFLFFLGGAIQGIAAISSLIPALSASFAFLGTSLGTVTGFFSGLVPAVVAFATTTIPSAIIAVSAFSSVLLSQAATSITTFATVSIPAAITAIGTFATVSIPAAITACSTFATVSIPAMLSGLGGLITNGITALSTSIASLVSGGITALSSGLSTLAYTILPPLTVAATLAAGAFVGWKIGEWARENIPLVKQLGDQLGDLILKIPLVESAINRLTGVSALQARTADQQNVAIQKLEASLAKHGVTVDRAGKSTDEYQAALLKAAKETGLLGSAASTERAKIELIKKEIQATDEKARLTAKAMAELGKSVRGAGRDHQDAKKPVKEVAQSIEDLVREVDKLHIGFRYLSGNDIPPLIQGLTRVNPPAADFFESIQSLGIEVKTVNQDLPKFISDIEAARINLIAAKIPADQFAGAMEKLKIKSTESFQVTAAEAAKARDIILGSGLATDFEKKTAIYRALDAQIQAARASGQAVSKEQSDLYEKLRSEVDTKTGDMGRKWETFGTRVSTAITNASQRMSSVLFDGDLSFSERFLKMGDILAQSFATSFIEPITAALTTFVTNVLIDLVTGKGFGSIIGEAKAAYNAIKDILGLGSAAASTAANAAGAGANAAGGAANAAGGAASAAGSVGSAAAGGPLAIVNAVAGVVTAAASVIQAFQLHGIGNDTGKIEENTRGILHQLRDGLQSQVNAHIPQLSNIHARWVEYLNEWREFGNWFQAFFVDRVKDIHDIIGGETNDLLRDIRNNLEIAFPSGEPVSSRAVNVTIYWNANDQSGLNSLRRELAAAGIKI